MNELSGVRDVTNKAISKTGGLRTKGVYKTSSANEPLVSIITVTFNSDNYIEQTIKSVINQTYKNIEYIIIDGGSTDGTLDSIEKYDSCVDYWVSEPDKGISDAFNKGIRMAAGDIIGIINSDDWYEPYTVETVIRSYQSNADAEIICGNVKYWSDDKEDYIFTSNPELLHKVMTVNHPTMFVKKGIYTKYGLFKEGYKYAMDYELALRFKMNGAKYVSIDKVLANMRLGGTSDKIWLNTYKEVRKIKYMYYTFIEVEPFFIKQVLSRFASQLLFKIGLEPVVAYYRRRFSMVKKVKAQ